MKVGGVGNSSWYVWDISQSSLPYDTQIVPNNAQLTNFKWCSVTDSVFATSGIKGSLQIRHYEHQNVSTKYSDYVQNDKLTIFRFLFHVHYQLSKISVGIQLCP